MSESQAATGSLYRKEPKLYPRDVHGRYARLRRLAMVVLLGLYYVVPWLQLDGRQAVLFDLPARKFYVLGITFFPQDFIYLALLLIAAGLSLFFFTALAGRLWCGYACPQTVWTDAFLIMERWAEGGRNKRMKLDKAPWTREKVLRKTAKHTMWALFAAWTGFTFVGFFVPIRELGHDILTFSAGGWETFWMVFYGFATWGNAGKLREQVCKYMCPYARFQSAMFDRDTLIISYDEARGEPRGGRRKSASKEDLGLGDCIDCTLCVQVCPTGIDIRDGLQYECIACAACIDACDQVMDKMDYPRGLIRYTTENALEEKTSRVIRPRILVYGTLLTALLAGIVISMFERTPLRADLIRDRNALFRELPDGRVENVYTLKLVNMDDERHRYTVAVESEWPVEIEVSPDLEVGAEEVGQFSLSMRLPADTFQGSRDVQVRFTAESDPSISRRTDANILLPFE